MSAAHRESSQAPLRGIAIHGSSAFLRGSIKTVVGAMLGAIAGLFLGTAMGAPSQRTVLLVGATLGVLMLGPGRPRSWDAWLGRGVLSVAMVMAGGMLATGGRGMLAAWAICSVGLALASSDPGRAHGGSWRAIEVVFRGAVAAAAMGLALLVMFNVDLSFAPSVIVPAALLGVGGFVAGRVVVFADAAAPSPRGGADPSREGAAARGEQASGPVVDADFTGSDQAGGSDVFCLEAARLSAVADRVEALLERTERENPDEGVFVDSVRERVQIMMAQVQASVQRWRQAGDGFEAARLEEIGEQLDANRLTLDGTADLGMCRELSLAIERQERMLSMLESMARARTTFGFRLGQVTSGLELLEVTLQRALTVGEGIDTSEIDALVEVMDAFEDDDLEPSSHVTRSPNHETDHPTQRKPDSDGGDGHDTQHVDNGQPSG